MSLIDKYVQAIDNLETFRSFGQITNIGEIIMESKGPDVVLGELCEIEQHDGSTVFAEVVGLREDRVQLMVFSEARNLQLGAHVYATGDSLRVPVGESVLGTIITPRDSVQHSIGKKTVSIHNTAPAVDQRAPIDQQFYTGIRAIDGLIPIGKGQRMGVFSGSGVGKSTLLGSVVKNSTEGINVIALIGERGREVQEFIKNILGPQGMERSVLVVSGSDDHPISRVRAASMAMRIAEYFRDASHDVLFVFDSVTRFARALREVALARGEVPAFRGFPPSVDSMIPKLLERCGKTDKGTITGLFSVLVEGDDLDEPVSDMLRGTLDGHIILSRKLARREHYPAIDVLGSVSRLASVICNEEHKACMRQIRQQMAIYDESEDLIQAGVYQAGSSERLDYAIHIREKLLQFLQQSTDQNAFKGTVLPSMQQIITP